MAQKLSAEQIKLNGLLLTGDRNQGTLFYNGNLIAYTGNFGGGSNTASDIGTGLEVYSGVVSNDFKFRRITGIGAVSAYISGDNTIVLSGGLVGGGTYTASNIGLGAQVLSGTSSNDFKFRSLTGDGNLVFQVVNNNTISGNLIGYLRNTGYWDSTLGFVNTNNFYIPLVDLTYSTIALDAGFQFNNTSFNLSRPIQEDLPDFYTLGRKETDSYTHRSFIPSYINGFYSGEGAFGLLINNDNDHINGQIPTGIGVKYNSNSCLCLSTYGGSIDGQVFTALLNPEDINVHYDNQCGIYVNSSTNRNTRGFKGFTNDVVFFANTFDYSLYYHGANFDGPKTGGDLYIMQGVPTQRIYFNVSDWVDQRNPTLSGLALTMTGSGRGSLTVSSGTNKMAISYNGIELLSPVRDYFGRSGVSGQYLMSVGSGTSWTTVSAGGTSSTASNIGTGLTVFSGIVNNDFKFRSITGVGAVTAYISGDNTIIISGSSAGGGSLAGGTLNFIPLWTSSSTLSSSLIYQGTGSNIALKTTTFDPINPETLKIEAGATNSINALSIYGTINNYLQLNLQNTGSGAFASSDLVLTNDIGNENNFYVDLGINSSQFNNPGFVGDSGDGYLYNLGNNFSIGNAGTGNFTRLNFFAGSPNVPSGTVFYIDSTGFHFQKTVYDSINYSGVSGQVLKSIGSGVYWKNDLVNFTMTADNGDFPLNTGIVGDIEIPFDARITKVTVLLQKTGLLWVDFWKTSYASYPPLPVNSITGSGTIPVKFTNIKYQDASLTGWRTTITGGDVIRFVITSGDLVSGATRASICLTALRL